MQVPNTNNISLEEISIPTDTTPNSTWTTDWKTKINSNNTKIDTAITDKITQVTLKSSLPVSPTTSNNLYIVYGDTTDNNGQYRWNGTTYEKISTNLPSNLVRYKDSAIGTPVNVDAQTFAGQLPSYYAKQGDMTDINNKIVQNMSIKGIPNKKYAIVAGVIRNDGTGWKAIGDHGSINIESVTINGDFIEVNYPSLGVIKVVSFVATPDETLVSEGYNFGASVGNTKASIKINRHITVSGYVSYNATSGAFEINNSHKGLLTADWVNNYLHLTFNDTAPSYVVPSLSGRNGNRFPVVFSTNGTTSLDIQFFNHDGTLITTPDVDCKVWINMHSFGSVSPNNLVSASGNIWLYGIFEI